MRIYTLLIILLILIPNIIQAISNQHNNSVEEIIIIPDTDPYFGIIGSNLACNYSNHNSKNIKPLIIQKEGKLTKIQNNFIQKYLNRENNKILILGEKIDTKYQTKEILGDITEISIEAAKYKYQKSSQIMIIPYGNDEKYTLSLIASPISNYLNIPLIIFNDNQEEINDFCKLLNIRKAYIIGNNQLQIKNINTTILRNADEIQNLNLEIIKEKFGQIKYITITNPADIIPPYHIDRNIIKINDNIKNIKITLFGRQHDITGYDKKYYNINIPDGINNIQIYANITKSNISLFKNNDILPILYLNIYDSNDNLIGYSSSLGYDFGKTYLDTLTCDSPGNYTIQIIIYNGIKGGYFSQRGISITDIEYQITIEKIQLEKPHMPMIPKLSMLAPYITSAHGGIILADPNFELTDENYSKFVKDISTGPWYNEILHEHNNKKVNYTINKLKQTLENIQKHDMLKDYLNGPAWLAILGDTNMIPMYYYTPSQQGILEKGLPSDNPYYLNFNLSVGRIVSYNVQDASNLISRTLFYEKICNKNISNESWHNKFNFIFGEGFGETGGIFHQIPYSKEIQKYGFKAEVYGNLKNSRQISEKLEIYTNSNYIEYLGHGDWFWYTPSLYGLDFYSKSIDVAHAKDWIYKNPSIFLTSACLMSRIDGIPSNMNIGLTMLHGGCNSFIGATRETGQEAGLEILENHLIIDNFSIGEALRGEKRIDKELPTYYVRTLYGDPAFNPYEPNNGFSNQGTPG